MALTQEQIAQMDQDSGLNQSSQPQSLTGALGNLGFNLLRGGSGLARNLGLGAVPDILGTGIMGAQETALGKNPFGNGDQFTPQQYQELVNQNPFMPSQASSLPGGLRNAAQDLAGAGGWLTGGLTGTATPWLARAGIGAASGGLMGLSNPQIKSPSDALTNVAAGAGTGAIANVAIPPLLKGASNFLTSLSYGKAGQAIPAITEETGKTIGGIGSKGAKAAVSNIGGKIEDLYNSLGGKDLRLTKDEFQNLVSDTGKLVPQYGLMNSPLDEMINKMNLSDPQMIDEAKNYIAPSYRLLQKAGQTGRGGVSFSGDFLETLNSYLEKNPAVMDYIEKNGGIQNIDKISLPTSFWAKLASDLDSKVPWEKITDPKTQAADFSKLGGRQSMQSMLANVIRQQVKDNVGIADPQKLAQLERLNGLYGSAKAIASGKARGIINPELMARYGLMLPAAIGVGAYTQKNTTLSPFLAGASALSFLANPALSGTIASQLGNTAVRAAIPAISSILGSRQAQQLFGGQQ